MSEVSAQIQPSDHPDFIGGIVWSPVELRWINARLERAQRMENALRGIASCGTRCGCCEMHKRVAQRALGMTQ